jgi:hypothetical protein
MNGTRLTCRQAVLFIAIDPRRLRNALEVSFLLIVICERASRLTARHRSEHSLPVGNRARTFRWSFDTSRLPLSLSRKKHVRRVVGRCFHLRDSTKAVGLPCSTSMIKSAISCSVCFYDLFRVHSQSDARRNLLPPTGST